MTLDYLKTVMNVPCVGKFHITVMPEHNWRILLERDSMYIAEMTNVFFNEEEPVLYPCDSNDPHVYTIESFMWEGLLSKISEMEAALEHDANPQHLHVQGTA